jgi:hypothetical protein
MTLLGVSVTENGLFRGCAPEVRRIPNSYPTGRHVERFGTAGVRVASARTPPPQSAVCEKISAPTQTNESARAVRTRVVARTMPRPASRPEGSRRPSAAVRFRLMLASASRTTHRTGDSARPPPLRVMVAHVWRSSCWSAGFTSTYLGASPGPAGTSHSRSAAAVKVAVRPCAGLRLSSVS